MSKLVGKNDFKHMHYLVHLIITALSMFYLGNANATVSDCYSAYKIPVKSLLGVRTKYISIESFKYNIS